MQGWCSGLSGLFTAAAAVSSVDSNHIQKYNFERFITFSLLLSQIINLAIRIWIGVIKKLEFCQRFLLNNCRIDTVTLTMFQKLWHKILYTFVTFTNSAFVNDQKRSRHHCYNKVTQIVIVVRDRILLQIHMKNHQKTVRVGAWLRCTWHPLYGLFFY